MGENGRVSKEMGSRSVREWVVNSAWEFGVGLTRKKVDKNKLPVRADFVDVAIGLGISGSFMVSCGLIWLGLVWAGG